MDRLNEEFSCIWVEGWIGMEEYRKGWTLVDIWLESGSTVARRIDGWLNKLKSECRYMGQVDAWINYEWLDGGENCWIEVDDWFGRRSECLAMVIIRQAGLECASSPFPAVERRSSGLCKGRHGDWPAIGAAYRSLWNRHAASPYDWPHHYGALGRSRRTTKRVAHIFMGQFSPV